MKKIIVILFLFHVQLLSAQSQFEVIIGGSMDDKGASMTGTSKSEYLISGSSYSYSPESCGLIIKTDSAGSLHWAKTYKQGSFFKFTEAFELSDGNYMFSGTVIDSFLPGGDMVLAKADTSGNIIWSKLYGTPGNDAIPTLNAISQMPDSGFVFVANCDTNFSGLDDISIIRTDKNGDTLWTKFYHAIYRDQAASIAPTNDGGFIISGRTNSFDNFIMDFFLMKADSVGEIEWAHRYGGTSWDEGADVIQTMDGGYAVCGSERSFSTGNDYDGLVFKTDSAGVVEWATAIGDTLQDALYSIVQSNDGGLVCTGYTTSFFNHQFRSSSLLDSDTTDIILFKLTASGDTLWSNVYGGDKIEETYSVHHSADNGYMIAGLTHSYSGNNSMDLIAIKTDSLGRSCSSSPINPIIYHPTLTSDTISFIQFSPITYKNYFLNVADIAINDSLLCYQFTSIKKLQDQIDFIISPNPFNYSFKIKMNNGTEPGNCTYKIMDVLGREVTSQFDITKLDNTLNFTRKPGLKTGFYMLMVSDGKNTNQSVKLVAQ